MNKTLIYSIFDSWKIHQNLYKNTTKSDEFSDTDILKDSWERENLFRI